MPHQCTNCGHVFEDGSKEMLSGCPDCGGNKFQYHPGDVPDPEEPPEGAEPPEREGGSVTGAVGRAANKVRDAVTSDDAAPTAGEDESTADDTDPAIDDLGESAADDSAASPGERADATESLAADAPETGGVGADDAATSGDHDSATTDAEPDARTTDVDVDAADADADADTATSEADGEPTDADPAAADPTTETVDATAADSEDGAQANARSEVVDMSSLPDRAEDGRVVQEPDDDDEDRPDLEELRQELNDQFESIRIVAPGQYELNLMELYDRQEYIIALQEDGQYVIEVPDAWEAPDPTKDE
jgi:predicted  nucleic acid-binding Zn-ribbon protein